MNWCCRQRLGAMGVDTTAMSDEDIQALAAERWRILIGEDANTLDTRVRQDPEHAFDVEFFESFAKEVGWRLN
jgi:hypothetical protein